MPLVELLSQHVQLSNLLTFVVVKGHVVILAILDVGLVEPNDSSSLDPVVSNQILEHFLSLVEKLFGFLTDCFIVENLGVRPVRVLASQLPCHEKRIPVDVINNLG